MEELHLRFDDVALEVHRYASSGPLICLLPGLGGGIQRFGPLAARLAAAGYQPVAINPRGAGASVGPLEGLRMRTLADDVGSVIRHFGAPAVVVGNAFGNRVARFLAASLPDLVAALVLVCAGGELPPEPDAAAAMQRFLDESLSESERLKAARQAFFAPGNEAAPELLDKGRTAAATESQMAAMRAEQDEEWLAGGNAPMLVIQGAHDRIARPENGHRLKARWPERVEVVDVPDAAHAVLNEQPGIVARAILDWLPSTTFT